MKSVRSVFLFVAMGSCLQCVLIQPCSAEDLKEPVNILQRDWRERGPLAYHKQQERQALLIAEGKIGQLIEEFEGINAVEWGEKISNPFSALTEAGIAKLKERGIDVAPLTSLRAVAISGSHGGALSKQFVNKDRNVILVLGDTFLNHGVVASRGPVVVTGDSYPMGKVYTDNILWVVEDAQVNAYEVFGDPMIVASERSLLAGSRAPLAERIWHGDYGWRRPTDWPVWKPRRENLGRRP